MTAIRLSGLIHALTTAAMLPVAAMKKAMNLEGCVKNGGSGMG